MELSELDDSRLLEKPLYQLKKMLEVIDELIQQAEQENGDPDAEALYYALRRAYVFKYNEIKRTLLSGFIHEIEKRALSDIIDTCNKKTIELEAEKIPNAESLLEFFDKMDIEYVEQNSQKVKETKESIDKPTNAHAVLFSINRIFLSYLDEAQAKIEETKDYINSIQEHIETVITEKTNLGLCTIVPVRKKQMQIKPLIKVSDLPDDVKEQVVYERLNMAKAKQWIAENPDQILFSVKEKDYYLRVLDKTAK